MNICDQKHGPRGRAGIVGRSARDITPGGRYGPSSKHRQAHSGWDSLTSVETRVAALVEEGLSNREIAGRLLSRRPVAARVSFILKKLGGHSRTHGARLKDVSDRSKALASAMEQ